MPLLIVFFVEILFVCIGMNDLAEEGVYMSGKTARLSPTKDLRPSNLTTTSIKIS